MKVTMEKMQTADAEGIAPKLSMDVYYLEPPPGACIYFNMKGLRSKLLLSTAGEISLCAAFMIP